MGDLGGNLEEGTYNLQGKGVRHGPRGTWLVFILTEHKVPSCYLASESCSKLRSSPFRYIWININRTVG